MAADDDDNDFDGDGATGNEVDDDDDDDFKNTHYNNLQVQKPHKIASIVYHLLSVIVTLFNVTP